MQPIQWDGQRITAPGVYANMPLSDYHRGDICDGPSLSSTSLRTIWNKSPKHFWADSKLNPARKDKHEADKPHFSFGRAVHHLVCGEKFFANEFVVRPAKAPDGRKWHASNDGCIAWTNRMLRAGKTILTEEQVEAIKSIALSLLAEPLIQKGILHGYVEHSMFWRDAKTGVWLKARPDAIPNDSGDFGDLKTTRSIAYRDTQKSIGEYGYHQQAGLVAEGCRALDLPFETFSLVWAETEEPHCTRIQQLRDEDIARGARQNRNCIDTFGRCYREWLKGDPLSNEAWPGPAQMREDAEPVDLPDWRRNQIDERLKYQLAENF